MRGSSASGEGLDSWARFGDILEFGVEVGGELICLYIVRGLSSGNQLLGFIELLLLSIHEVFSAASWEFIAISDETDAFLHILETDRLELACKYLH